MKTQETFDDAMTHKTKVTPEKTQDIQNMSSGIHCYASRSIIRLEHSLFKFVWEHVAT